MTSPADPTSRSSREEEAPLVRRPSAESWVGATFVLLVQVRTLMIGIIVIFEEGVRDDPWALEILAVAAVTSASVVLAWERLVPLLIRHPALLAFDVLLGYGVLRAGGIFGTYFLFTVVTAGLAGLLYRWRVVALICVQQIALYAVALHESDLPDGLSADAFPVQIGMPAFYPIAASMGLVLRRLFEEHALAEQARWRIAALAMAADERSRLAREMHDSLTGTLAGIGLTAKGLPLWLRKSPERAELEAQKIAAAAEAASHDARALIADLRGSTATEPLAEVLERIAADWTRASGVGIRIAISTDAEPEPAARQEALAIVRESLENVARHAAATSVELRLARYGARLELSVRDDGRGLAIRPGSPGWLDTLAEDGHYGIVGLHERAMRAGGELSVTSEPGVGTRILLTVPVESCFLLREPKRARRHARGRGRSPMSTGRGQ